MAPTDPLPYHRDSLLDSLTRVFATEDRKELSELARQLERITVRGGERLFRQGDPGDAMYVLVSGRLQARLEDPEGGSRLLGEVARGEMVGEMALFTGEPRSASIYAVRDSVLARIGKPTFDRLLESHPRMLKGLTNLLIERLRERTTGARSSVRAIANVAVVPAGGDPPLADFCRHLAEALGVHGTVLHLAAETVAERSGLPAAAAAEEGTEDHARLTAWLDERELEHRFVLYQADPALTPWTRRSLRQADIVLVLAEASRPPDPGPVVSSLLSRGGGPGAAHRALVLLQPSTIEQPSGTARWLDATPGDEHYHLREGAAEDLARLARILAGEAVGLVLGGGAARGFAHLGVYRALRETGIPIDLVGGSSIGASLAAPMALEWEPGRYLEVARREFVEVNPFGDVTIPVVSLVKGERLEAMLRRHFDFDIEDLWLPFFCVSSNLSRGEIIVQERGPLWEALRSSVALPGVMPPAVAGNDLLIDGGILNNLPVDVMRQRPAGHVIAVELYVQKEYQLDYTKVPSAWQILRSRYLPFTRRLRVPGIVTLMMKATEVSSIVHAKQARQMADLWLNPPVARFGIMDVKSFDRIVQVGYDHAREALEGWDWRPPGRGR